MADKKSILEEALLDIKNIQSALNANTKEILRSVAREEINSVVKESFMEQESDFDEEDIDTPMGVDDTEVAATAGDDAIGTDMGGVDDTSIDGLDDMGGSEEVAPEMEPELGMDADALGGDEMDMTASSDDDVIAIYKKLSGEDEIEIIGDEIHLNVSEPGEYVVKLNDKGAGAGMDDMAPEMGGEELGPEIGADDMAPEMGGEESTDDVDYEIEMGDDTEGGEETETSSVETGAEETETPDDTEEDDRDEPLDEFIQQNRVERVGNDLTDIKGTGVPKSERLDEGKQLANAIAKKYNVLLAEAKKLKNENIEFRTALRGFRGKLVETVVINSNLAYFVRLINEHSTTKSEKANIIKRFDDEVSNLIESQKLYKTIDNELSARKPITESIDKKLIKEVSTSTSTQLHESTAYVDPSTQRIKDLINRVEQR